MSATEKLAAALWEADRHMETLTEALAEWGRSPAVSWEALKLGYLNVEDWLAWREVRNRLAHEYPDQPEIRFAAPIAAIDAARSLAALYQDWRTRLDAAELT